jgi:hypothetical protein
LLQRVACTTGDDRTDLLTGEPRWAAVAEVIERAIDSNGAHERASVSTTDV